MKKEGKIGIFFLKEIWNYYNGLKLNNPKVDSVEWKYINGVFNALGIGLEPTFQYLMHASSTFCEFESWIEQNGRLSKHIINHFNSIILNEVNDEIKKEEKVFDEVDLEKWNKDGYVILKNAISKDDCLETINFISKKIGVTLKDEKSWYLPHPLKKGIMIQLFNATILDKNRLSNKIKLAFEQLWNKKNLMVSMDRVSFNPPETDIYKFQGPNLHWDVSLKQPIPYGTQGLLYLNDIEEDQGAFTLIPGFHNIIHDWLKTIKTDPRTVKLLDMFEEKPIAGNAGDLIIWNHCLPHGSRPNNSNFPRFVQYINYQPLDLECQNEWI